MKFKTIALTLALVVAIVSTAVAADKLFNLTNLKSGGSEGMVTLLSGQTISSGFGDTYRFDKSVSSLYCVATYSAPVGVTNISITSFGSLDNSNFISLGSHTITTSGTTTWPINTIPKFTYMKSTVSAVTGHFSTNVLWKCLASH